MVIVLLNISKVEALIKERGWSKVYFNKQFGHSVAWINDWKRGYLPSDATIALIADKLGTTVEYLTDQTDNKNKPDTVDGVELTDSEKLILEFYRSAPPELRAAIERQAGIK
jgi:transcriptional regulator with XRE-family HTH domain